jgi:hypothetical protein
MVTSAMRAKGGIPHWILAPKRTRRSVSLQNENAFYDRCAEPMKASGCDRR